MGQETYGQGELMEGEGMVDILEAQISAIWPQEEPLLRRYELPAAPAILDLACGTGAASEKLLDLYPKATLVGLDLVESSLERARERCTRFDERSRFSVGDAYAIDETDGTFDLAVCRHLLQIVDEPGRILDELLRVLKPGGRLHLLVEDYGMIHFHPAPLDVDAFWREGPRVAAGSTGGDLWFGRKAFTLLTDRPVERIGLDYLQIDTVRVPREHMAAIWRAWAGSYVEFVVENSALPRERVVAAWDAMLACLNDPRGYAIWHVPVFTAVKAT